MVGKLICNINNYRLNSCWFLNVFQLPCVSDDVNLLMVVKIPFHSHVSFLVENFEIVDMLWFSKSRMCLEKGAVYCWIH